MINFDEEIKKFQPSLEVEDTEEAVYNGTNMDITDVISKLLDKIGLGQVTPADVTGKLPEEYFKEE